MLPFFKILKKRLPPQEVSETYPVFITNRETQKITPKRQTAEIVKNSLCLKKHKKTAPRRAAR